MRLAALLLLAACATKPQYLGTEVPKPCTSRDVEGCLGWMMERDLLAAELGIYADPHLRGYVQRVVERLAAAAKLGSAPRVIIADSDETYATAGRRIVIARTTIEKLDSEAELAGILAHELAHIEGRHVLVSLFGRPESDNAANRRDAEAVADERAVALLAQAGYAPTAMATALAAVLDADDEDHPARIDRIARVAQLAADRGGFVGRAEFLANIDHMILGRDPRLGHRIHDAWVVPALGLAIDLEDGDRVTSEDDILVLKRGRSSVLAYAVGIPWGRELASQLVEPTTERTTVATITRGRMPARALVREEDSPLGKLARAIRNTLPQPAAKTPTAIALAKHGALVLELGGKPANIELRAATDAELQAAAPRRIVIEHAQTNGVAASVCPGRSLERNASREVSAGDPIKCVARNSVRPN
jgi:predicted Zn-dependent protease